MALVVMCGQPCSGKSTAAKRLADALQSAFSAGGDQGLAVRVIDESSLHLGRNQSYAGLLFAFDTNQSFLLLLFFFFAEILRSVVTDMVAEKNLRGVLRSEVDRSLSKDSIIIVDSLNNIKVLALSLSLSLELTHTDTNIKHT